MTDAYVYAGGENGYVYKYNESDLSYVTQSTYSNGLIRGLAFDDDYVFTGTWGRQLNKLNKSDLSYIASSSIMNYANDLDIDNNYVYVLTDENTTSSIRKFTKNLVQERTTGFGGTPIHVANDTDYLYVVGYKQYVKKYAKSDLSNVTTSDNLGGWIYDVEVDDNYVYVTVDTVKKIKKLNKSDLSYVGESAALPAVSARLCSDNNYIYTVPNTSPYYVRKYAKSDLSLVTISDYNIGATVQDIECSRGYVYACGANFIVKLNITDLSHVTHIWHASTLYELEVESPSTVAFELNLNESLEIFGNPAMVFTLDLNESLGTYYYIPNSGEDYEKINDSNPKAHNANTFINNNKQEIQRFFGLPDYEIDLDVINKIEVHVIAKVEENTNNNLVIAIKESDNVYYGNNIMLNTYWLDYSQTWKKNPVTNNHWTLDDINNLQIGFKALESNANILVSAVYMILYYENYSNPHFSVNDFISSMLSSNKDLVLTFDENNIIILHKPYLGDSLTGNLGFDYTNLQFKNIEHYESYINSLNRNSITITGFEYDNAFYKLSTISNFADKGKTVIITWLDETWNDTYVISNISYKTIGKYCGENVWEYSITLLKAEDEIYEP